MQGTIDFVYNNSGKLDKLVNNLGVIANFSLVGYVNDNINDISGVKFAQNTIKEEDHIGKVYFNLCGLVFLQK